jgi:hypothetical protein
MKTFWRERNLAIVLLALFLGTWLIQLWTGWQQFQSEQTEHAQTAVWFGQDGYIWSFLQSTMENWQSEFLQLLTFVVLTSFLVFRGSPESRDSDDEMKVLLESIEKRLIVVEGAVVPQPTGNGRATPASGAPKAT